MGLIDSVVGLLERDPHNREVFVDDGIAQGRYNKVKFSARASTEGLVANHPDAFRNLTEPFIRTEVPAEVPVEPKPSINFDAPTFMTTPKAPEARPTLPVDDKQEVNRTAAVAQVMAEIERIRQEAEMQQSKEVSDDR